MAWSPSVNDGQQAPLIALYPRRLRRSAPALKYGCDRPRPAAAPRLPTSATGDDSSRLACSGYVAAGQAALRRLRSAATIAWRSSLSERLSTASGVTFAMSLRRAYWSKPRACRQHSGPARRRCPPRSSRCASTRRTWPIRCTPAMACASIDGVSCGSDEDGDARGLMFNPTPPTCIWETSTAWPRGLRELVDDRLAVGGRDVAGQRAEHGTPSARPALRPPCSSTSRKYLNTTALRSPFGWPRDDLDQPPTLGDPSPSRNAAGASP